MVGRKVLAYAVAACAAIAPCLSAGRPALAAAGVTIDCDTPTPTATQPVHPRALRWGINPRVQAGQIGVQQAAVPAVDSQQLAALSTLSAGQAGRAGAVPFVLRLNRLFFPEPAGQAAALDHDVTMYGNAGYLLELQLRFHPTDLAPGVPDQGGGDPAAFATWAAQLVHRYDANPALVSVQVANETNVNYSFDSSDGFYTRSMAAMAAGVTAVKQQATSDGQPHVRVGTNWVYRGLPQVDKAYWDTFKDDAAARGSLDWMGLDAYPGTFPFPSRPASYYAALAGDLDLLRRCFMAYAGIAGTVPVYIEETGWPTAYPLRPAFTQVTALRQLTAAAHDYAGTYNVTDFRWFNLRDADSSSPNFQQHFGLLTSAYQRKPAFCAYRAVVTGLADCPGGGPASTASPTARVPTVAVSSVLPGTAASRTPTRALTAFVLTVGVLVLACLAGPPLLRRLRRD